MGGGELLPVLNLLVYVPLDGFTAFSPPFQPPPAGPGPVGPSLPGGAPVPRLTPLLLQRREQAEGVLILCLFLHSWCVLSSSS